MLSSNSKRYQIYASPQNAQNSHANNRSQQPGFSGRMMTNKTQDYAIHNPAVPELDYQVSYGQAQGIQPPHAIPNRQILGERQRDLVPWHKKNLPERNYNFSFEKSNLGTFWNKKKIEKLIKKKLTKNWNLRGGQIQLGRNYRFNTSSKRKQNRIRRRKIKRCQRRDSPLDLRVSQIREKAIERMETLKLSPNKALWLENKDFIQECLLGLQSFNLQQASDFEKLGLFNHELVDETSIYFKNPRAEDLVNYIMKNRLDGLELDFGSIDSSAQESLNLNFKDEGFTKNFFGRNFMKNIQKKLNVSSKSDNESDGVDEGTNGKEKSKSSKSKFRIKVNNFDKPIELNSDFDLEILIGLGKPDLQILAERKFFVIFVQKNWRKFRKRNMLIVAKKMVKGLRITELTQTQGNFIHLLMKVDFVNIEDNYMLFDGFKRIQDWDKKYPRYQQTQYESYEEMISEVERLRMRDWFIREVILKNFSEFFNNDIGHRMILKFLKDELLVERLKNDRIFHRVDVSPQAYFSQDELQGWFRKLGRGKKLIPSGTPLLDFLISFVNENFFELRNSTKMDILMTNLFVFTEIKLVCCEEVSKRNRPRLVQRFADEDKGFMMRFGTLIRYMESDPFNILGKIQTNKSLSILLTKLDDDFLFPFFFEVYPNLKFMISSKHCNYIVQEVLERVDEYQRGERMIYLNLEEINDPKISALIDINEFTYEQNIDKICQDIYQTARTTLVLGFNRIMTQKYAKFVVCQMLKKNKMRSKESEFLQSMVNKMTNIMNRGDSTSIFISEAGLSAVIMLISILPLGQKFRLIRACGMTTLKEIEKLTKTPKIFGFIEILFKYYSCLREYKKQFRTTYPKGVPELKNMKGKKANVNVNYRD